MPLNYFEKCIVKLFAFIKKEQNNNVRNTFQNRAYNKIFPVQDMKKNGEVEFEILSCFTSVLDRMCRSL